MTYDLWCYYLVTCWFGITVLIWNWLLTLQPTWVNWDVTSVCLKALEHFLQFAHPYFRHRTPSLKTVSNAVTRKHRTLGCAVCSENDTTRKKNTSNNQTFKVYPHITQPGNQWDMGRTDICPKSKTLCWKHRWYLRLKFRYLAVLQQRSARMPKPEV